MDDKRLEKVFRILFASPPDITLVTTDTSRRNLK